MDEDTKLVLQMWRVQVMENHRLAGVSDHLQQRITDLEKELRDARKRTDAGGADADWRRVGRGRRRDPDSSD
jgi:hypothetical protein